MEILSQLDKLLVDTFMKLVLKVDIFIFCQANPLLQYIYLNNSGNK